MTSVEMMIEVCKITGNDMHCSNHANDNGATEINGYPIAALDAIWLEQHQLHS